MTGFLLKVPLWFGLLYFASAFGGASFIFAFLLGRSESFYVFIALVFTMCASIICFVWSGKDYEKKHPVSHWGLGK